MARPRKSPLVEDESKKLKDTNRKLKSELLKLRKKVKIQQAQLKRYKDLDDHINSDEEYEVAEVEIVTYHCPKCDAEVDEIVAGNFTLHKCTECEWKGRK